MNELYWIGRVGALYDIATLFVILFGLALICCFIWLTTRIDGEEEIELPKKYTKCIFLMFVVCSLILALCPSKKEMYLIYGVGNVIDYVQSNDVAKQLPDKAIIAIDKWLEMNKPEEEDE